MRKENMNLGRTTYINNGIDMANIFFNISQEDEKTSKILYEKGHYNQSVYFLSERKEGFHSQIQMPR